MFFCEPCRISSDWPAGLNLSVGPCEVCKRVAPCHDISSRHLPPLPGRRFARWCAECGDEVDGPFLYMSTDGVIYHWLNNDDNERHPVIEKMLPTE